MTPDASARGTLRIRDFRPDDLEAAYELDQRCFEREIAYTRGQIRSFLSRSGAVGLIAESTDGSPGSPSASRRHPRPRRDDRRRRVRAAARSRQGAPHRASPAAGGRRRPAGAARGRPAQRRRHPVLRADGVPGEEAAARLLRARPGRDADGGRRPKTRDPGPSASAVGRNPALRDDVRTHRAVVELPGLLDHLVDVEEQARLGDVAEERPVHRFDHGAGDAQPDRADEVAALADVRHLVGHDLAQQLAHAVARLRLVGEDVVEDPVDVEIERQPHQLAHEGRRRHDRLGERRGKSR